MSVRRRVPRRRRFFIGCEGESEQGYAKLLQNFADDRGLSIHIDAQVLRNSGDPKACAELAEHLINKDQRLKKPPYVHRFLILDTDLIGQNSNRDAQMWRILDRAQITLLKQETCFEAFLLRHFSGYENNRPATNNQAKIQLERVLPNYRKGMSAQELSNYLTVDQIISAAECRLNQDFQSLLTALGFINPSQ